MQDYLMLKWTWTSLQQNKQTDHLLFQQQNLK